jgi:hypothetical protein
MKLKKTWFEKLTALSPEECLPLGGTPRASVYSAIFKNREALDALGLKFRVQTDEKTKKEFVCRVK